MKTNLSNPENLSADGDKTQKDNPGSDLSVGEMRKMEEEKMRKLKVKEQQFAQFTAVARFWSAFNRVLESLPMWKVAATRLHMRPNTYFSELNYFCLAAGVGVVNFMSFRFSVGKLAMPVSMTAQREGRQVTLVWSNDTALGGCHADDELVLGYFYDSEPGAPQMVRHTGAVRKDERLEIEIPPCNNPEGETLHLYPFFCNKELTGFSQNYYFKV